MPLYDFRCTRCSEEFEVLMGVTSDDGPPSSCPECGHDELVRLISAPAMRVYTQFIDEGTHNLMLAHKKDIEEQARNGNLISLKEKGPSEYRPQIPKQFH